jgi:hypothetical protein
MKKFECIVTRTDKYIIEFDENIINEEWMEEFRKYSYSFYTLKEHAEHLAQHRARFETNFIEGYAVPLVNNKQPILTDEEDLEKGINIKIISEDEECEVDVVEI